MMAMNLHFFNPLTKLGLFLTILLNPVVSFGREANVFNFWYGQGQSFGGTGIAQRYVNLLGNLDRTQDFSELNFSLNDGPFRFLSIGSDKRRLWQKGDFNVEIPIGELLTGKNSVVLQAVDSTGMLYSESVDFYWNPQTTSPDRILRWEDISDLNQVAQPIDGLWRIEEDRVISDPAFIGYDRILGIGDLSWRNYEVLFPFEVRGVDPGSYDSKYSGGPGLLYIMHWKGHTDSPEPCPQPHCGYEPFGVTTYYGWPKDEVGGWSLSTKSGGADFVLPEVEFEFGKRYWFRGRNETTGAGNWYAYKVWQGSLGDEPNGWTGKALGDSLNMESGSFLLVAHHIDLAVGTMEFTSLANLRQDVTKIILTHTDIVVQLPFLAIWIIGIVWAVTFRRRDPQRGKWVLVSFVLLLISSLVGLFLIESIPGFLQTQGWGTRRLTLIYVLIHAIPVGGHLAAWAILFRMLLPPNTRLDSK